MNRLVNKDDLADVESNYKKLIADGNKTVFDTLINVVEDKGLVEFPSNEEPTASYNMHSSNTDENNISTTTTVKVAINAVTYSSKGDLRCSLSLLKDGSTMNGWRPFSALTNIDYASIIAGLIKLY